MLKFINKLNQITPDRIEQRKQLAYTLGLVLGMSAGLPTEAIEDPRGFFIVSYLGDAMEVVARVNEITPFDTELALFLFEGCWLERYYKAYPKNLYTFLTNLSNDLDFLSRENVIYLSDNKIAIDNIHLLLVDLDLLQVTEK